jgi:ribosomal protein L37AE/L43A
MKIKHIKSQSRRDFTAIYECEHCGATETGYGYDDSNFHENVIPAMKCKVCGKTAAKDVDAVETVLAKLLIKYGNHRQGCDTRTDHSYPCSCGYIRVLDSAMAIAFGNRNKNPNRAIIERERK